MKIPKTIMQTYSDENALSLKMKEVIQDWKNKNKEYKHVLFYNEDCINFIKKHFNDDVLTAFNTIIPGAGKADLFRYCYLYIKGGVYSDVDNICLKPLDSWLKENDKFISILDYNGPDQVTAYGLYQAFIACTPEHPFLKEAIKLATYNILNQIIPNTKMTKYLPTSITPLLTITGPKCLADAINICLGRSLNTLFTRGEYGDGFRLPAQLTFTGILHGAYQQREGVMKDRFGEILIQAKYEGYTPKEKYWLCANLYK